PRAFAGLPASMHAHGCMSFLFPESGMFFHQWLLAGALALPVAGMAAEAVSLSPEQARTLGVRFQSIQSSDELNISAHARVVLRPDAQVVVAAPYAGALPRVLVAVGQSVREG